MSAPNKTVRRLNRDLEAVASAVRRANTGVSNIENGLNALSRRILAAKRKREEMLRGTHSGQINTTNMRRKHGGSRRGRKGRRGTKRRGSTRRK